MKNDLPLDHFALRVSDREAALPSLTRIGYEVVADFLIPLKDGSFAKSYALRKAGEAADEDMIQAARKLFGLDDK